jgi:uncharacterized membrane-anchored protein YhcB (DUF1043 family)
MIMSDEPVTIRRSVLFSVALITFIILITGYVLNSKTHTKLEAKEREYAQLKEQQTQMQDSSGELKRKYDGATQQAAEVTKEYESLLHKQQECSAKLESLQIQNDVSHNTPSNGQTATQPNANKSSPTPSADVQAAPQENPAIQPPKAPTTPDAQTPEHPTASTGQVKK